MTLSIGALTGYIDLDVDGAERALDHVEQSMDSAAGSMKGAALAGTRAFEDMNSGAQRAGSRMDSVAESSDNMATRGAQAAGALAGLGALASLAGGQFGALGQAMMVGGIAAQGLADAGDLVNVVTQSTILAKAKDMAVTAAHTAATVAATTAQKVAAAATWAWNVALSANPIGLVVLAIVALVAAVVLIATKTQWGHDIVVAAWDGIRAAVEAVARFFTQTLPAWFSAAWGAIKDATTSGIDTVVRWVTGIPGKFAAGLSSLGSTVRDLFDGAMTAGKNKVTGIGDTIVEWIKGIPGKMAALGSNFGTAGRDLLQDFIDGMKNAAGIITGIAGNVWDAVRGLLNGAIDKINAALEFRIDKGPVHIGIDPPDIPHLRTGGRTKANAPGMAWIGDANEPESVLRDSQLKALLREAVSQAVGMQPATAGGPLIGQVVQQPGESADTLAERLWFKTRTRG